MYAVDGDSGRLTLLGIVPTGGENPRNFGVDPTGNFVLCGNQSSDTVTYHRLDPDTGLLHLSGVVAEIPHGGVLEDGRVGLNPPPCARNKTRPGGSSSIVRGASPCPSRNTWRPSGAYSLGAARRTGRPRVWTPDEETVRRSNLQASMSAVGIDRYEDFHAWSVRDPTAFWTHTLKRLGIVFTRPPDAILDLRGEAHDSPGGVRDPRWLPGAKLNIVDSCFTADPDLPAVVMPGTNGPAAAPNPDGPTDRMDRDTPDAPDHPA